MSLPRPRPAIGFVVPAFNAAATVLDTLAGLLRQTRRDWCAVLVDDGSTDATASRLAVVRDPRVRLVRQSNRGLAGARNTGWTAMGEGVRPEFACFLDADDVIVPDFCEAALRAIGDADAVAGGYRMVDEHLRDLAWRVHVTPRDVTTDRLVEFNPLAIGAVLFRASTLDRCTLRRGPFDEHLRVHEDWDLLLRMARAGCRWAPPVDADLMLYRQRPGSLTGDLERMWRTGLEVIESAPVGPASLRARAARRWTVRHAARACAGADAELAARFFGYLRPLVPDDTAAFIDAATWAVLKHERIGPRAAAARAGELAMRFAGAMPRTDAIDRVESALRRALRALDAGLVARAAANRLQPGQTLVLYGLGRQGTAILNALTALAHPPALAVIDDDPGVGGCPGVLRLRITDLTPRHIVLVTPMEPGPILARLTRTAAACVLTPTDLLEPSPAALAG
jgi:hypothetical protein